MGRERPSVSSLGPFPFVLFLSGTIKRVVNEERLTCPVGVFSPFCLAVWWFGA